MTWLCAVGASLMAGFLTWSIATADYQSASIRAGVLTFNLLAFIHFQFGDDEE